MSSVRGLRDLLPGQCTAFLLALPSECGAVAGLTLESDPQRLDGDAEGAQGHPVAAGCGVLVPHICTALYFRFSLMGIQWNFISSCFHSY